VTLYLVRHAKAGNRRAWDLDDDLRPLSAAGRRQADAIADVLVDARIERMISSPYVRCRQTVDPLALRLRLPVELADELAEGTSTTDTMRLLEKVVTQTTALCTHGDVLQNVLDFLASSGVPLDDNRLEKGSIWAIDVHDTNMVAGHYLPPPA
jgi:phosphohistidine phosphatase SixA